ncbi:MAG: hypothetical protein ACTIJ9_11400 [Aequorivita sp.]
MSFWEIVAVAVLVVAAVALVVISGGAALAAIGAIAAATTTTGVVVGSLVLTAEVAGMYFGAKAIYDYAQDGDEEALFREVALGYLFLGAGKLLEKGFRAWKAARAGDEVVEVLADGVKAGDDLAEGAVRTVDDFVPSSGAQLVGNPEKTTTILGRWVGDMENIKPSMLPKEMNVGTAFGEVAENPGGFNFLDVPQKLYDPDTFFELYNKPWLDAAINRGDDIILATKPIFKGRVIDVKTGNLIGAYAEELQYLVRQNYKPINLSASEWNTIKSWF